MELIEKIKQHELESYRLYATRIPTTFGCLYFNSDNPESYDSNHAHITHYENSLEALEVIEVFYLSKGIRPRIYGQTAGELERLRPFLAERKFQLSVEPITLMVCRPDKAAVSPAPTKSVRTVREIEEVANLIRAVDQGDWNVKAVQRCLSSPSYTLFAAYEGESGRSASPRFKPTPNWAWGWSTT